MKNFLQWRKYFISALFMMVAINPMYLLNIYDDASVTEELNF